MKFIKLDLLTLLISLFLFASCENTSTIGLEIDPKSKVEGALVDTLSIASRTVTDEVIATTNLTRHPLGYLKDPIFGTSESSLAFSLGLPNASFNFGAFDSLDSAVLVLNYAGEFYGDSTLTYSFDVHQLSSNITLDELFPSNREYGVFSGVIGTKTGRLYPNTKFKITDIVTGAKDTLRSVVPQLRIKLDPTFVIQNLISLTANNSIKNDVALANFFNGLHVQVNKTLSTGNGGMAFFDFAGTTATSNLSIYYKKGPVGGPLDTVLVAFPITQTANKVAATIKHNYTGTPIEAQLNNPNQQYAVTYLQPMVGLRNKISFPSLSKFASNIGKIVVNKAELVIDLASGTDIRPFEAAPRLSLYRYDIAEQRINLPDNSQATDVRGLDASVYGGYFNSITKQYVFVITSYIQDLINNKTKDYGTFLAPTPTNEFLVTPSLTSAARAVIGANKKNPAVGESTMKLNIYYTKVN